jgi:hypothetical protein
MHAPGEKGIDCTPLPRVTPVEFIVVYCCAAAAGVCNTGIAFGLKVDASKAGCGCRFL